MCELFGMSANRPVTAGETLAEFRRSGKLAGKLITHPDMRNDAPAPDRACRCREKETAP